ncbi:hypothetical protein [Sphingomonas changnyeongensis]|uniref:hypothetical protein n=1 Tax=Sphingomonas changnyeongensis TaxID=2698679 RepID=UPI001E5789E5|nr:hypothetical protein [Sphingomonas changnyeongensis]
MAAVIVLRRATAGTCRTMRNAENMPHCNINLFGRHRADGKNLPAGKPVKAAQYGATVMTASIACNMEQVAMAATAHRHCKILPAMLSADRINGHGPAGADRRARAQMAGQVRDRIWQAAAAAILAAGIAAAVRLALIAAAQTPGTLTLRLDPPPPAAPCPPSTAPPTGRSSSSIPAMAAMIRARWRRAARRAKRI